MGNSEDEANLLAVRENNYEVYVERLQARPGLAKELSDHVLATPIREYSDIIDQASLMIARVVAGDMPPVVSQEVTRLMEFQLTALSAKMVFNHNERDRDTKGLDIQLLLDKAKTQAGNFSANYTLDVKEK